MESQKYLFAGQKNTVPLGFLFYDVDWPLSSGVRSVVQKLLQDSVAWARGNVSAATRSRRS